MTIFEIHTIDEVLKYWDFLLEGLVAANESQKWVEQRIPVDKFFKQVIQTVKLPPNEFLIAVMEEGGHLLGYIINFMVVKPNTHAQIWCYLAYSINDNSYMMKELLQYGEAWARDKGYKEIMCNSARFSAASFRMFEKRWKFRRLSVTFSKLL